MTDYWKKTSKMKIIQGRNLFTICLNFYQIVPVQVFCFIENNKIENMVRFSILKQMCLKPNKRAYGNGFTCQRFKNHTHLMQWGEFAAGPHLLSNCLANSMIESCQYLEFFNCCCQLCCEWFRGNYWCAKIHARVNFAIVNWNSTRWWLWKKICDSTGLMHILLQV